MGFYIVTNKKASSLFRTIDLDGFDVALADIYIPDSVLAQAQPLTITAVSVEQGEPKSETKRVKLVDVSTHSLIRALSQELKGYASQISLEDKECISIHLNPGTSVQFSRTLSGILGIRSGQLDGKVVGEYPVNVKSLLSRVLVMTNTVEPYHVNGGFLPCIYVGVPQTSMQKLLFHASPPYFLSLLTIDFCNLWMDRLDIPDESFCVKLKFQRTCEKS